MTKVSDYFRKSIKVLRREGLPILFLKVVRKFRGHFIKDKKGLVSLSEIQPFNLSSKDLIDNQLVIDRFQRKGKMEIKKINWFLPFFTHPMGGVNTIFRFAKYYKDKKGVESRFVICDNPLVSEFEIRNVIKKYFPDFVKSGIYNHAQNEEDISKLPACNVGIATRWDTAYSLLKFNKTNSKFYFVQDYEPLFYAAGTEYALAQATYRFGFFGICNTKGVFDEYRKYGSEATFFTPSVDTNIYYPETKKEKVFRIFFYGRPTTPRNSFDLGIAALRRIKEIYGDRVDIVTAGEEWDEDQFNLKGLIRNLGLIKTIKEVADLYRTCDVGLVFMFTKHPSYQPLEFMASGMVTVINKNEANLWLFKDGINCSLSEPTPNSIVEKIKSLIENENLKRNLVKGGLETIKGLPSWEEEMERVWRFMVRED